MTTYNAAAVANAAIAHRKGISLQTGRSLRDNPIAMMEGATGAPKLLGLAVATPAQSPVLTVTASDTVQLSSSNMVEQILTTTQDESNPPVVVARRITIIAVTGSIRLNASSSSASTARLSLYKNGVLVQAYTGSGARTIDVSAIPNDVFEWRMSTNVAFNAVTFSDASETASNGYVIRIPVAPFLSP
jgi:hypothetical protein